MTNDQCLADLAAIAPAMDALRKDEQALVRYEILSGSLVWSDEFPSHTKVNTDCLRFVFRYRTELILGQRECQYGPSWREALNCFPNWIGFDASRTERNPELAVYYENERTRILGELRPEG